MTRMIVKLLLLAFALCLIPVIVGPALRREQPYAWDVVAFIANRAPENVDLFVQDLSRDITLTVIQSQRNLAFPKWSPDGQRLAYLEGMGFEYVLYETDMVEGRTARLAGNVQAFSWSPDGHTIALKIANRIYLLDRTSSGAKPVPISPDGPIAHDPTWSGDSQSIFFSASRDNFNDSLYRYDVATGETHSISTSLGVKRGLLMSEGSAGDDAHLFYISNTGGTWSLYRFNMMTGHTVRLTDESSTEISPALSPYSDEIIFTSNVPGIGPEIQAIGFDGRNRRKLMPYAAHPAFRP